MDLSLAVQPVTRPVLTHHVDHPERRFPTHPAVHLATAMHRVVRLDLLECAGLPGLLAELRHHMDRTVPMVQPGQLVPQALTVPQAQPVPLVLTVLMGHIDERLFTAPTVRTAHTAHTAHTGL